MPNRTTQVHEATRLARRNLHEVGREIRVARITAGLTQAEVARRAGTSPAQLSRFENGRVPTIALLSAHRIAAVVGLRLYLKAFPGGRRLLDAPQLALLRRLRDRVHPAATWRFEVTVPKPGDLRAADALITLAHVTVAVEAITRLADFQAQLRAAQAKARDLNADRLLLLVGATTANREAVRSAGPILTAALPVTTRPALAALAAGEDLGADALVFL